MGKVVAASRDRGKRRQGGRTPKQSAGEPAHSKGYFVARTFRVSTTSSRMRLSAAPA